MKVGFDGRIKLEFHGAKVTSDDGLFAYRDLDDTLGLFKSVSAVFDDNRAGRNIQHAVPTLFRQSIYSRLAGYEDVNDAKRLSLDHVIRAITGKKDKGKQAASTNTMGRFETEILTEHENIRNLSDINDTWIQKAMSKTPHQRIILDMDSSERTVYGEQEGSAYNGHFGYTCFHPLFCLNQFGDCEGVLLCSGNVYSADREIYEYLEENGYLYAIRLSANDILYEKIRHLLTRPVGRPPKKPTVWLYEFSYQAASWDKPRHVLAKVEWHEGELFSKVGFIVTTMSAKPKGVVQFYNGRDNAE